MSGLRCGRARCTEFCNWAVRVSSLKAVIVVAVVPGVAMCIEKLAERQVLGGAGAREKGRS